MDPWLHEKTGPTATKDEILIRLRFSNWKFTGSLSTALLQSAQAKPENLFFLFRDRNQDWSQLKEDKKENKDNPSSLISLKDLITETSTSTTKPTQARVPRVNNPFSIGSPRLHGPKWSLLPGWRSLYQQQSMMVRSFRLVSIWDGYHLEVSKQKALV
jgi:hypothetical protein